MSGYRVVAVSPINKKKYKILLEGAEEITISLYPSELRRFCIKEDNLISDGEYSQIEEILYKRGKERALYYLKDSDRTSFQMRKKLREGYYPEKIIDKVLDFLEKYGYIDDLRYSEHYIFYNYKRKSILQIKNDLRVKGISKDIIDVAFENHSFDSSDECQCQRDIIRKFIEKKIKSDMDLQNKNKIVSALVRKGFLYDDVLSVFREIENTKCCI